MDAVEASFLDVDVDVDDGGVGFLEVGVGGVCSGVGGVCSEARGASIDSGVYRLAAGSVSLDSEVDRLELGDAGGVGVLLPRAGPGVERRGGEPEPETEPETEPEPEPEVGTA